MRLTILLAGMTLAAPLAFAEPLKLNDDIKPAVYQQIVVEAKDGPLMLRRYVKRLQTLNVRIDFDTAVEIAQEACVNDANSRQAHVWNAANVAGSACEGWISRTFARVES